MESNEASLLLIILGIVSVAVGFFVGGWFWGNFIFIGASWVAAGVIYALAEREVSDGGLIIAFVLGPVGAIVWVVIDMSRSQRERHSWKERRRANREYNYEEPYHPILNEFDDPDLNYMFRKLVSEYRDQGFLNPELRAKSELNRKTSSGKTKEDAIRELYEEEIKKSTK